MKRCHKCGAPWVSEKKQPSAQEYCEPCSAYLHCCKNCRFHDPKAHNQCFIPNTDWVGDRVRGNFCDEFEFSDSGATQGDSAQEEAARNTLDALFGEDESSKRPQSLDDLFGG